VNKLPCNVLGKRRKGKSVRKKEKGRRIPCATFPVTSPFRSAKGGRGEGGREEVLSPTFIPFRGGKLKGRGGQTSLEKVPENKQKERKPWAGRTRGRKNETKDEKGIRRWR